MASCPSPATRQAADRHREPGRLCGSPPDTKILCEQHWIHPVPTAGGVPGGQVLLQGGQAGHKTLPEVFQYVSASRAIHHHRHHHRPRRLVALRIRIVDLGIGCKCWCCGSAGSCMSSSMRALNPQNELTRVLLVGRLPPVSHTTVLVSLGCLMLHRSTRPGCCP